MHFIKIFKVIFFPQLFVYARPFSGYSLRIYNAMQILLKGEKLQHRNLQRQNNTKFFFHNLANTSG